MGFSEDFCKLIEEGFGILLGRRITPFWGKNYSSLSEFPEKVQTELDRWEKIGVFEYVETRPTIVNPLGAVFKKNKTRLFVDCSGSGLNDCLWCPYFKLPTVQSAIRKMKKFSWQLTLDLEDGFFHIPLKSSEVDLLGFQHPINGRWARFRFLPFGLRSAPFIFCTFSGAVVCWVRRRVGGSHTVYVDDWHISAPSEEALHTTYLQVVKLCELLGLRIKHAKTKGPSMVITFLGLEIDTKNCTLNLPEEKRLKILDEIQRLSSIDKVDGTTLTSIAGKLVHIAITCRDGPFHTRSLWELLYSKVDHIPKKHALKRLSLDVNTEVKADLAFWSNKLKTPLSRKLWTLADNSLTIWNSSLAKDPAFQGAVVCTDSSLKGWGACYGTKELNGAWSIRQAEHGINWCETKAVILAIQALSELKNKGVIVYTDNITAISIINHRSPCSRHLQKLTEELDKLEKMRGIEIGAAHLPGVLNSWPDALSRGHSTSDATLIPFQLNVLRSLVDLPDKLTLIGCVGHVPLSRVPGKNMRPQNPFVIIASTPDAGIVVRTLEEWGHGIHQGWIVLPSLQTPHQSIIRRSKCCAIITETSYDIVFFPSQAPKTMVAWSIFHWKNTL